MACRQRGLTNAKKSKIVNCRDWDAGKGFTWFWDIILLNFSPSSNSKKSLLLSTRQYEKLGEFYLTKLFQGITSVHNVFQWRILGNMFLWTTIYMWRRTRPVSQNCSIAGNVQEFSTSALFCQISEFIFQNFGLSEKNLFHYPSYSANFNSVWFGSKLFSRLKPK